MDSRWEGKLDTAVVNEESVIPEYLDKLILYTRFEYTKVCMKDSRHLTQGDLDTLVEAVESSDSKHIVITHGTYTMPDSAKYLKANLQRNDQVIIFTGSMIPLRGFESSDAPFNLGYAVAKVEDLPSGIYLAMNGRVFSPDEVVKNLFEGKFFSVFEKKQ